MTQGNILNSKMRRICMAIMLCISVVCFGKTGEWDLPEGIDAFFAFL